MLVPVQRWTAVGDSAAAPRGRPRSRARREERSARAGAPGEREAREGGEGGGERSEAPARRPAGPRRPQRATPPRREISRYEASRPVRRCYARMKTTPSRVLPPRRQPGPRTTRLPNVPRRLLAMPVRTPTPTTSLRSRC